MLKDTIFGGMEEYITTNMYSDYDVALYGLSGAPSPAVSYVSPSSYYGDPTRVFDSSEGEELVGKFIEALRRMKSFKCIHCQTKL